MTADQPFPGLDLPDLQWLNNITSATSSSQMKPTQCDTAFVGKVSVPLAIDTAMGFLKVNVKNSDYLLFGPAGPGRAPHTALRN